MKQQLVATKEFAVLCKTTKRTIIHYDQIGLLKPKTKIGLNRWYAQQQVLTFEKIALLQSLGFSLSEIQQRLNNRQSLIKIFIENKQKIAEKQRQINLQMKKVTEILYNLEKHKTLIAPQIKQIKAYNFFGIEKVGKYAEISVYCDELRQAIDNHHDATFTYLIVFDQYGYSPVRAKMIVGVRGNKSLPQSIKIKKIHSNKFTALTYTHIGSHAYLGYVTNFLEEYVRKNKLTLDHQNKVREIYIKGPANETHEENYVTEIQFPI